MSDEPEVSSKRLLRNTAASAVASVVVAVLAVALTPFFLEHLGQEEYGVWLLATTLTFANGYMGLADLGLQQAAVRLVADARSRGDVAAINRTVSTMLVLFVVLGVVLGALLAVLANTIATLFNVEAAVRDAATVVFALVGVQIALDLPTAAFLAVLEGAQRYAPLRLVEVGSRLAWAIAAVVLVVMGRGVVALAVSSLVVAVVAAAVAIVFAKRVQPGLHVSPSAFSRESLGAIVRQGKSMLTLRITSVVYRQMDRAIVGIALGTAAVARYEVAYKIHATAAMMLSIAPSAVMPAAAYLDAAEDRERLRRLYLRGTKYAVAFSLPVSIAALLYAKPLIATWVGEEYVSLTDETRLFLVYPVLVAVHVIGLTMLVGLGRMREMVILSPASVALNFIVSIVLVDRLGIAGVIWGTLAGYLAIWFPYLRLMLHAFGVRLSEWLARIVVPNVPGLAVQLALGALTLRWAESLGQLWQVGAVVAFSCAASLAVFLLFVLSSGERHTLLSAVRRTRSGASPMEPEEAIVVARGFETGPVEGPQ